MPGAGSGMKMSKNHRADDFAQRIISLKLCGAVRPMMLRRVAGTLVMLATIIAWPVLASDFPNKPIKVISDSAPGSAVDVTFRMVMDRLGTVLGQQIIPVDQPGAGGAIAAHAASESIPDGYTLFAPALSLFISLPGKAENLPLILPRDFLPVGSLAQLSVFICASPQSGIKTLPDLIARAKEHPGEISFAATGIGRITHLTGLLLQNRAGIKLEAVPYAGGPAAALTDVIGGRVPLIIEGYSGLAGAIQAHSINVLAVASAHRLPDFPDVPTVAETLPGFAAGGWQGIVAPLGTPAAVHTEDQRKPEKGAGRAGACQTTRIARRLCRSNVAV
jgi:tripartite-type tricarboxylate transporter receptor subunit TctC